MFQPSSATSVPLAFSYLRFSTPEQQRGDSFRRQKDLAERYAARFGLELDGRSFQDLGVSAFRGANAETGMLGEFLQAVGAGIVPQGSYLLVESLDRLSRTKPRRALRLLEQICELGIAVVTLADERTYTIESLDDDHMTLMYALMVAVRANEESATKSRRLKASWESKRRKAQHVPLTSVAPAWVALREDRTGFDLVPDRAAVVRRIFEEYLNGMGPHSIAEGLNRDELTPFGRAKFWHRSYVIKILDNPSSKGTFIPHILDHSSGQKRRVPLEPIEDYFPAAINIETFARVAAMRAQRYAPHHRTGTTISHLLAGLARCPRCGGSVIRVTKGSTIRAGRPYLVCSRAKAGAGCHYRAVHVADAEASIINALPGLAEAMPRGSPTLLDVEARLVAERDGLEADIQRWLEELHVGGPSRAIGDMVRRAEEKHDRAMQDLAKVRVRLNSAGPAIRARRFEELREALAEGTCRLTEANARLRALFSSVAVDPVARTLTFAWQSGGRTVLPLLSPGGR